MERQTTEHRIIAGVGELKLTVSSATHVGHVRAINEDSLLAEPPLFAVADGMGGHALGDLASATAVRALREQLDADSPTGQGQVLTAIRRANSAVRALASWSGSKRVIAGTTLTGVALVVDHPEAVPRWMVFNLGDSRVYRWDTSGPSPRLDRVSIDHSIVQELVDAREITEAQARSHPERNVITRALGAADEVASEAWLLPAEQSQTFLICSDGLTKELDDEQIAAVLAEGDPTSTVDRLLTAALDAGGHDNVTIVLVRAEYRDLQHREARGDELVDEQTHDRALSPELDDTRPRR